MINVVVNVGLVGVFRSPGKESANALGNGQKLQADVIDLGAPFAYRPDGIFLQQRIAFDGGVQVALQLRDGQPRGRAAASSFALVGDAPVVRLVISLKRQKRVGRGQRFGGLNEFAEIAAAAAQAPTEPHAGLLMQVQIGLHGRGALRRKPLNAAPDPAKSGVSHHFDRLRQRLSAIGKGGIDADAVQEIGRRDGGCVDDRLREANRRGAAHEYEQRGCSCDPRCSHPHLHCQFSGASLATILRTIRAARNAGSARLSLRRYTSRARYKSWVAILRL